jgi:hypothetical protein
MLPKVFPRSFRSLPGVFPKTLVTFAIIYRTATALYSVVVESVRGQIEKGRGEGEQDDVPLSVRIKQQLQV